MCNLQMRRQKVYMLCAIDWLIYDIPFVTGQYAQLGQYPVNTR